MSGGAAVAASPRAWLLALCALLLLHDAVHFWPWEQSKDAPARPLRPLTADAAVNGLFEYAPGDTTSLCAAQVWSIREDAREMYLHAYGSYLRVLNASIAAGGGTACDELQPLSCTCRVSQSRGTLDDIIGNYALTLIDSLPATATMGDATTFRCAVSFLVSQLDFNRDVTVSVFEVIIRLVGGLISAHMLSTHASTAALLWPVQVGQAVKDGRVSESDWGCDDTCPCAVAAARAERTSTSPSCVCLTEYSGQLLHLAHDLAQRLLPAFDTPSGLPYHLVNLKRGRVSPSEPGTCAAAAATNLLEFAALSALTGDDRFSIAAHRALGALWRLKSSVGLIPASVNVETGGATGAHTGVGAGVDSAWEYMLKGGIALDDETIAEMWDEALNGVGYMDMADVHVEVGMDGRVQPRPAIFSALQAFLPAALTLHGSIRAASSYHIPALALWGAHGAIPDAFDMTTGSPVSFAAHAPLRPEALEASYHLFMATRDGAHLLNAAHMLAHMHDRSRVACGYASLADVRTDRLDDRCDSYVFAETFKYVWEAANHALVHWCDTHACAKAYAHSLTCERPVLSRLHGDVTTRVARMKPVDDALLGEVRARFPAAHPLAFASRQGGVSPQLPMRLLRGEDDTSAPRVCATTRVWTHDVYAPAAGQREAVRLQPCINASLVPPRHALDYAWLPMRDDVLVYTTEGHPFMIDLMRPSLDADVPVDAAPTSASAAAPSSDSSESSSHRRTSRRTCAVRELEGTPAHPQNRGDGVHLTVNPQFLLQNMPSFTEVIAPRAKLAYAQAVVANTRAAAPSYAAAASASASVSPASISHLKALHDAFSSAITRAHAHESCSVGVWSSESAEDSAVHEAGITAAAHHTSHFVSSTGAMHALRDIAKRLVVEAGASVSQADVLKSLAAGMPPTSSGVHMSLVAVAHGFTRMCVGQWAGVPSQQQQPFAPSSFSAGMAPVPHLPLYLRALAFICTHRGGDATAGNECMASVAWNDAMISPQPSLLHIHGVPELATVPASAYTEIHPLVREFHARFMTHAHGRNGAMRTYSRSVHADADEAGTYLLGHPCGFGPLLTPYGLVGLQMVVLPSSHAQACSVPADWVVEENMGSCDDDAHRDGSGPHVMLVVLRGGCSFATKATVAAQVHAHALLVLDVLTDVTVASTTSNGAAEGMFVMSDDESNAGAKAAIPVTMLTGAHARVLWEVVASASARCVHACLSAAAPSHTEYARVGAYVDGDSTRVAHMYDEHRDDSKQAQQSPTHVWSARAHVPHLSHTMRQVLQSVSSSDAA